MMDGDYQNDTPPTLGKLIRDAAMDHSIQPPCSDGSRAAWRELRRLTELSDACERLAKAADAADLRGLPCAHLGAGREGRVSVDEDGWRRLNVAVGSIVAALAAYREEVNRG